jgi:hypothetical protein
VDYSIVCGFQPTAFEQPTAEEVILTDYRQQMIDRLLMQFNESPFLHGVLNATGEELNLLGQVFQDLKTKRWIDTAEGLHLDGCGQIVQQDRRISQAIIIPFFGFAEQLGTTGFEQGRIRSDRETYLSTATLPDTEYKQIIWAKVAKNITSGTAEETIQSLSQLYGAKIILADSGNATITISIGKRLTDAEIVLANALDLLIRSGGVGITSKSYFAEGNTFGFSDQNQGYLGFDQGILAVEF